MRPLRLLLTGLNGTLAPKLAELASRLGMTVIGWDRARWPPEHAAACAAAWRESRPDAVAHLASGSVAWAAWLAAAAAREDKPLLFTSTAMVFHHQPDGPHRVDDTRTAVDDYGRYKMAAEDAIRAACAHACIARIGWQIDADARGNNMLAHLDQWQQREGEVAASRAWRPACSFMEDTASALLDALRARRAGLLHLDSNADEGFTFDAVVLALKQAFARAAWCVRVHEDYRHDQRLLGGPVALPPLSARLPLRSG